MHHKFRSRVTESRRFHENVQKLFDNTKMAKFEQRY